MSLALGYVVAALLGALVGVVEVLQRYRAEPFRALSNLWGLGYTAFNGGVALIAFFVLTRASQLTDDTADLDLLSSSAAAGFGSAAVLRAKLMNIKLGDGKELALGPELIVQTFLSVIDRELDRYRARERYTIVRELFAGIDFELAKARLPLQVFGAMQTVSEEENEKLMARIAEVDGLKTIDSQDKAYQLGFYLLDLVGEEFLTDVLKRYGDDFRPPKAAAPGP